MSLVIVALASKHRKESLLAPAFESLLGWTLEVADFDTDSLGTFTGDVPRLLSPMETVLAKARAGALALGVSQGLASEGTIGPHPAIPFVTVTRELVAFVDIATGVQVVESVVSSNIHAISETWSEGTSLPSLAERADFPRHAVIVRTAGSEGPVIVKGIRSSEKLAQAIELCRRAGEGSDVVIETDYRAMECPSRQAIIHECAWKLARRLTQTCSRCGTRGWGVVDVEFGVECGGCHTISPGAIRADIEGCAGCDFRVVLPRETKSIDPAWCNVCNP